MREQVPKDNLSAESLGGNISAIPPNHKNLLPTETCSRKGGLSDSEEEVRTRTRCQICFRRDHSHGDPPQPKGIWRQSGCYNVRNHDVESLPPSRTPGSHRRPPTRHTGRAQKLLPRLQIMDPAHPKTPFRQYRIPHREETAVMEGDVSGSFDISRPLHRNSIRKLPPGAHGCGCGSGLDQRFFSRRALGCEWRQCIVPRP
jgi:hypothetical protein